MPLQPFGLCWPGRKKNITSRCKWKQTAIKGHSNCYGLAQYSSCLTERHFFQDLIVGKSDGNIEVYAYDDGDDSEPILKYAHVSSGLFLDQFFL